MRELTVRISFTKHCLGSVKSRAKDASFTLPRSPSGTVTFLASWHHANMRFAAQLLGKHQDEVGKILWDINVDGLPQGDGWYRRYYWASNGKRRYVVHEAFLAGQVVGLNCVVPSTITDDDFWRLMALSGQYRGLSPWKPGEYGFFGVEGLRPRRRQHEQDMESGGPEKQNEPPSCQLDGSFSCETDELA